MHGDMSSMYGSPIETIFQRIELSVPRTDYTVSNPVDSWFQVDMAADSSSRTVSNITHYTFCTHPDLQPDAWHLLASADNLKWHRLDARKGEKSPAWPNATKTFKISADSYKQYDGDDFRYFKLQVTRCCCSARCLPSIC